MFCIQILDAFFGTTLPGAEDTVVFTLTVSILSTAFVGLLGLFLLSPPTSSFLFIYLKPLSLPLSRDHHRH